MSYPNTPQPKIGYLCTYVPEEIIHAAGFLPVRIMPNTTPPTRAEAHLQSYTCCFARGCLDLALTGKLNDWAGVVFTHTCDTMQGLADIWRAAFPTLFVDTVVAPVVLNTPHARAYLIAELRRFTTALEQHFGVRVTDDALRASIRLYNARRRALADFYAHRHERTAVQWFNFMNKVLTSPPEEIRDWRLEIPQSPISNLQSPISLVLLGATIDEPTLPQILDDLGARIVADDFCNGARYFDTLVAEDGDPIEAIAARELARAACPCKHRALNDRIERVLRLVKENRADGVIFYHKKFCDPHAWDYPPLAAALDRENIPHLLLEVEQVAPMGQTRVRVEAFLEMLTT
ncbi:MAG: 2-hydroxyacyl-CoA dehydratase family protein [Anaerolineae bacterium]|nr:2-hydroxyacyl-CoA dehydratase family protein [Anaerolineae bacterium]